MTARETGRDPGQETRTWATTGALALAALLVGVSVASAVTVLAPPLALGKLVSDDDRVFERFGSAVATDGRRLVVGAPENGIGRAGAVHVFGLGPTWGDHAMLVAPDEDAFGRLGWSVDVEGDTVVAGAPSDMLGPCCDTDGGSVYVFRDAQGWSFEQRITAPVPVRRGGFGSAVVLDGDTLVVGAAHRGGVFEAIGRAYVYERSDDGWSFVQELDNTGASIFFGGAVALTGETIVVGDLGDGNAGPFQRGAAHVFERVDGRWERAATLRPLNNVGIESIAFSVAAARDTVVLGSQGAGVAYVYERAAGGWQQTARLVHADPNLFFGHGLATDGTIVAVGAPGGGAGAFVHLYVRDDAGGWTLGHEVPNPGAAREFGWSVAMGGCTLVAGDPGDEEGGPQAGAAYPYLMLPAVTVAAPVEDTEVPVEGVSACVEMLVGTELGVPELGPVPPGT